VAAHGKVDSSPGQRKAGLPRRLGDTTSTMSITRSNNLPFALQCLTPRRSSSLRLPSSSLQVTNLSVQLTSSSLWFCAELTRTFKICSLGQLPIEAVFNSV